VLAARGRIFGAPLMCGICGVISRSGAALRHPDAPPRMRDTLIHRGPDGAGSADHPGASLQIRRLAIVDLARGDQPFTSPDGQVSIVCNGEIYNSEELRRDPAAADYPFRSRSDVESVLPLYLRYGADAIPMLEGMFAIAIWDARKRQLLLARDRSGEKPLFYAECDDELVFGSEPKALLAYPAVPRELDPAAAATYVAMGYVHAPRTMHRAIRKVPPGHTLTADARGLRIDAYWRATEFGYRGTTPEAIRDTLRAAVQRELMADVPLGIFISGGMDSSFLLALAAPQYAPGRLFTYTAGFGDPDYDETGPAALLARTFGTEHRVVPCDPPNLRRAFDALTASFDEPLGDPAILPTWLLAEAARENVKVVLSGEGADELFGGYPTYVGHGLAARYARLPGVIRSAIRRAVFAWPASPGKVTLEFLLKRFVTNAALTPVDRHYEWFGALGPAATPAMLGPRGASGLADARAELAARGAAATAGRGLLDGILLLDFLTYLPDDLLTKVDRATMLRSVEARAPFLDRTVMELGLAISSADKVRGLKTKVGLKAAAQGAVPAEILNRRKRGLSVPIASWINAELKDEVDRVFEPRRLDAEGWLSAAEVHRLLDEHRRGAANHARRLWPLVMFQRWLERWGSPTAS
jgi:asparagine synthase (glutamine-hydrolysing)